ncbi:MAG TPA: hypothetical protein VJQ59_08135 [Candidatus Sulfotelmatobacter sp.]|nr:hypothetical protein [Candidatus Sulfotelmatobacter sp.]
MARHSSVMMLDKGELDFTGTLGFADRPVTPADFALGVCPDIYNSIFHDNRQNAGGKH